MDSRYFVGKVNRNTKKRFNFKPWQKKIALFAILFLVLQTVSFFTPALQPNKKAHAAVPTWDWGAGVPAYAGTGVSITPDNLRICFTDPVNMASDPAGHYARIKKVSNHLSIADLGIIAFGSYSGQQCWQRNPNVTLEYNTHYEITLDADSFYLGSEVPGNGNYAIDQNTWMFWTQEAPGNIPVTSVSVAPTSATLTSVGATRQLTQTISPANATDQTVSWGSSNTGVATVDTYGTVTAVANGNATITVTTEDGSHTATSAITVSIAPNTYTVSPSTQAGCIITPNTPQTVSSGGEVSFDGSAQAGYTYTGFLIDGSTTTSSSAYTIGNLTSNHTIRANCTANTNTVTFDANGGTGTMANQTYTTGVYQNLRSNAFTKTGYTFAGWATSTNGVVVYGNGISVTMSANITLYAKWTANNNIVTFDANGGSGTMANQTYVTDVYQSLRSNTFTRTGYTFAGWATSSGGAVVYGNAISVTMSANITLYAKWTINYSVDFNSNGGSAVSSQTIPSGGLVTRPTDPTKALYTFSNWVINGTQTVWNFATNTVTSALTLFANWTANPAVATPSFSPAAATFNASQSVTISSTTSGATIKYTTTGVAPSAGCTDGTTYSSAITVAATTTIKAIACKTNQPDSAVATAIYTINPAAQVVAPTISAQPTNQTVTEPATATFTVAAANGNGTLSYQWQSAAAGSSTFANISNATSASYTTPATATGDSGKQFKVVVTNSAGSVTSAARTLTVNAANTYNITPTVTTYTTSGATVSFSTLPSNTGSGFNLNVTPSTTATHTVPTGRSHVTTYDITPSITPDGSFSSTITLTYPAGQTYHAGDTVSYWDSEAGEWSSEGITNITGTVGGSTIAFTTTHFSEFGVLAASSTGNTTPTTLPSTGYGTKLYLSILVNLGLALMFELMILFMFGGIRKRAKTSR